MKLLTLIFAVCFIPAMAGKKTNEYRVTGKIVDEKLAGVPFTTVLVVNAADTTLIKGALTDSLGNFDIQFADTGRFMLTADVVGYTKYYSAPFDITTANKTFNAGEIKLTTPAPGMLGEVEIVTRKKFIDMQAGKIILTPDNSPVSSGSTAYEVLKRAPGVSIDQNQNLTLKGKTNIMIFIDDKPTYMTQDQLMNYLKSLPASTIATIEIINNPGAKYDAAGTAGVINIRTKKLKTKGYNGSVRVAGGYGWYHKSNVGAQANYRNKSLNVFGGYGYNNGVRGDRNYFIRDIPNENGLTVFDQYFENKSHNISHSYKFGTDFFLTQKSTLGFLVKGFTAPGSEVMTNTTQVVGYNPMGFSTLVATNTHETPSSNFTANLNFAHTFDSLGLKKLNVDFDFSPFKADNAGKYFTRYYDANSNEILTPQDVRSSNFSDVNIYAGKIDYSMPIGKTTNFECGAKSSYVSTDNAIKFELVDASGAISYDSSRSNDFRYNENINAAYVNLSKQNKKTSITLGLRTEHTWNEGFSKTLDSTVTRQYVNLFPSANLGWDIDSSNNLNLAYSRRIDRPSYQDLNPFLYFADQYSFMKGNPFLKPQFTHGISLTHTFMQFLFTTVGTDLTVDYMAEIIEQDTATKLSFMTNANFDRYSNYYVNVSTGMPIKKLMIMFNFTGFYNEFKTTYKTANIDNGQFTYNVWMSLAYSFKHDFKLEFSGYYNSKAIYGIFNMSPMYSIDGGLKKSFPKTGLQIDINVSDIFNTLKNNIVLSDGINAVFKNKWETRVVRMAVSWNFGKADLKPRKRSTATEDEQGRVKSGGGGLGK
ncbi:MAG TPA: outer membrane beta-barrel protein [Flavobacteriales bacterium]|nr:outer membrane beta-barrel protein [Flavobacteriales bacterium]